jgi:hypothetical protein
MAANRMRILVIDVGGTHVKVLATGHKKFVEIPSGRKMTRGDHLRGTCHYSRLENMMLSRLAILDLRPWSPHQ